MNAKAPPGRRSAPGRKSESAPESFGGDTPIVARPATTARISLRHGLAAIYVTDPDPLSIALRRMRRGRTLSDAQQDVYRAWLAEQRQDAAS